MSTGSAILRPGTIAVPQVFEAIVQRCIDDGDLQCEHVRKVEIWHLIGSEKRPLHTHRASHLSTVLAFPVSSEFFANRSQECGHLPWR